MLASGQFVRAITNELQKPTYLDSSSVGHSWAGQEALNMNSGATGNFSVSEGKNRPQRKADLANVTFSFLFVAKT